MVPSPPSDPGDPGAKHANGNGSNGASLNGAGHADEHEQEADETGDPEGGLGLALPAREPPPNAVAELVAACMRFVASKYQVALDGTPETLSLVDQYVRDGRDAVKQRPESLELVAPAIGAYLGEVMRGQFAAEWVAEGPHDAWRLYFTNVYLAFNPLGLAREALTMRDADGWHAHLDLDPGERDIVEARLAAMPEVDEEEYYLPSTRLDVITAVVETLHAHGEAAGTADVTFTREDYE